MKIEGNVHHGARCKLEPCAVIECDAADGGSVRRIAHCRGFPGRPCADESDGHGHRDACGYREASDGAGPLTLMAVGCCGFGCGGWSLPILRCRDPGRLAATNERQHRRFAVGQCAQFVERRDLGQRRCAHFTVQLSDGEVFGHMLGGPAQPVEKALAGARVDLLTHVEVPGRGFFGRASRYARRPYFIHSAASLAGT